MTVHTYGATELGKVRRGDRLTAVDGYTLRNPRTVTRRLSAPAGGAPSIGLGETPAGVTVNLYPSSAVERAVTVERSAGKPRTRTAGTVTVVAVAPGHWQTPDGRYVIECGPGGITVCERPHPIRTGRQRGEACPGGQEHTFDEWSAWDTVRDDYVPGADHETTFRDALETLRQYLER